MNTIDQNDDIVCEVCFCNRPVDILLTTCAHSHIFCEKYVKGWLAGGHPTCPKCRAIWSIQNYLVKTNQSHVGIANASLTRNYHPPSTTQNIYSTLSSTAGRLVQNILKCYSIGLLLALVIYPAVTHIS